MYQHGRRTRQPRNMAVFLATIAIVGVIITAGWYIVHQDIAGSTDPISSVPIVSEVAGATDTTKTITEREFTIDLPDDWERLGKPDAGSINAYKYRSTAQGKESRTLAVHVDIIPTKYKLVKLQPIYPDKNALRLGNMSNACTNFAKHNDKSNVEFEAKWENILFVCDPIEANQTIGTGTPGSGIATRVGSHTFFFYFEDHNIRPDDFMFRRILESFRAK